MKSLQIFLIGIFISFQCFSQQDKDVPRQTTPIMGWSSWNNFHVNITEKLIEEEADAMVSSGMKDAGYRFINIDDGYFGGRDQEGNITANPDRFPNGMKVVADYIHARGLKAGIYSDAGFNTCGSMYDKDHSGVGMGLYNHERGDINLFFKKWGYDFLKVDYCGAQKMGLDEQTRYTLISRIIREIKPEAVYNVCRWEFPGNWVVNIADSWRISGDIQSNFKSIMRIIDLNADLWKYAGPGHVNDMDMLQVGRGMSYEEDKTHFSMWCMMASPLLAGNDLRKMSKETIAILTNRELIAIDQDPLVYQARRILREGDKEVWARPLISSMSGEIAVALLNRSDEEQRIAFSPDSVGLIASKGYTMKDLWSKKEFEKQVSKVQEFEVAPHGIVVLRIKGESKPFNIFQKKP